MFALPWILFRVYSTIHCLVWYSSGLADCLLLGKRIKVLNYFMASSVLLTWETQPSSQPWNTPFSGIPGPILFAAHVFHTVKAVSSLPLQSLCVTVTLHRLTGCDCIWWMIQQFWRGSGWSSRAAAAAAGLFHHKICFLIGGTVTM